MTSLIDNTIDELIRRVRQRPAMSDVVFMAAYPPRELGNPIDRYTVTVNNTGVSQSTVFIGDAVSDGQRGCLYDAEVSLRVYAPRHTSASALLRVTSLLYDALISCDTDDAIASSSMGAVAYDNAARTVYRDVTVCLRYLLCGEGSR